jgi:hypothetical protein
MKTPLGLLLAGVLLISCSSDYPFFSSVKAEGPIVREKIKLDEFNSINLMISGNIQIQQGEVQEVEIEAPRNLIDIMNKDVDDKNWKIKFDKNVRYAEKITLYITVKELTSAAVSGSGSIKGISDFKTNKTGSFIISGSGNIEIAMDCPEMEAVISGSGNIQLSGLTSDMDAAISGSGDIHAEKLKAKDVAIAISGSGDGYFDVTESLKVSILGSGSVFYDGTPKIEASITGSGKVKPNR